MDVFVEFARPFTLNLDGGGSIPFKAGQQRIDEALLSHWYVQANLVNPDPNKIRSGTKDFLKEDLEIARRLMQEEAESAKRKEALLKLRTRAVAASIQQTVRNQQSIDWDSLTPAQKVLLEGAQREQAKRDKELGDEILATIKNAVEPEETAAGGPNGAAAPTLPADAQGQPEPKTTEDSGTKEPKPTGRPKL
jgi:hypothetical protein